MISCSQIQKWFVSLKNKVFPGRLKLTEDEIEKFVPRKQGKQTEEQINWKPNEEQIKTLRHVCYEAVGKPSFRPLFTLYKELRKQYFV